MAVDLFTKVAAEERLNSSFTALLTSPGFFPARQMAREIAETYVDRDGNFVEQFQTTAFDARLWELYLHACLAEWGFTLENSFESPDYIATKDGKLIGIEAVTVNPTQGELRTGDNDPFAGMSEADRFLHEREHLYPIKFGSPLYSKLKKKYWELPHIAGAPLVIAIEDFQSLGSMTYTSSAIERYLFGVHFDWTHANNGTLEISPKEIEKHIHGNKEIPSGFFDQEHSENISAVLFSNSGTIAKFNRMGYLRGYGTESLMMFRFGTCYDHEPNASKPMWFEYEVGCPDFPEDWVQGLSMFHNPNALIPIDRDLFTRIAHHEQTDGGWTMSSIPAFHPISSHTPFVVVPMDRISRKIMRFNMVQYCNERFEECSKILNELH